MTIELQDDCRHGNINNMSASDLNTKIMDKFRDAGVENHSTILLGAGASITSGLPGWDTFTTRLLINSGAVDEVAAGVLLSRQDPLIAVEAARVASQDKWERNLRHALYENVGSGRNLSPSPLHRETVAHYLEQPGNTSLVTLNFDLLLEQEMMEELGGPKPVPVTDSAETSSEHVVHHLHGVISSEETKDVVLTLRDFTSLIEEVDSWQVQYLRSAVQRGALIIAGTSYRDPDLRQWLHKALKGMPAAHKAFVLLAREAFDVNKDAFEDLQEALSDQWRAIGLEPILLHDHTDAAQIIRELRHIHKDGYVAPQERCRVVWDVHERNFEKLQRQYVEMLAEDAAEIKYEFNVDSIDLTLWLSDGRGNLIRWASQDRIYRDSGSLRTIESGHDSSWIAGRALGDDALLMEDLDEEPTRRWRSVLAVPVPVTHSGLPSVSCAVLTVGLPGNTESYLESNQIWENKIVDISNKWGIQLASSVNIGGMA